MSIDVTSKLHDYSDPAMPPIKVHSSWSYTSRFVELEVDGKRYTVSADELKRAIENATNCGH